MAISSGVLMLGGGCRNNDIFQPSFGGEYGHDGCLIKEIKIRKVDVYSLDGEYEYKKANSCHLLNLWTSKCGNKMVIDLRLGLGRAHLAMLDKYAFNAWAIIFNQKDAEAVVSFMDIDGGDINERYPNLKYIFWMSRDKSLLNFIKISAMGGKNDNSQGSFGLSDSPVRGEIECLSKAMEDSSEEFNSVTNYMLNTDH